MKTIKTLLNETKDRRIGNHKVVFESPHERAFYYHDTVICRVNDKERIFSVHDGGWTTPSTTQAINTYKQELDETHLIVGEWGTLFMTALKYFDKHKKRPPFIKWQGEIYSIEELDNYSPEDYYGIFMDSIAVDENGNEIRK